MIEFLHYCTITGSTVNDFDYGQDEEHPDCVALTIAPLVLRSLIYRFTGDIFLQSVRINSGCKIR